ncbi:MAG TPA: trigger factor [Firmicutes bacterium]|nr:trigger factor [Bacillota bacterium]
MKVDTKALENNKKEIQVECPAEQVAQALEQAYKKVVRGVSVPGFRKGKVPRQILEMRYGVEVLYDDAIEILLPEVYEAALAEAAVEPIDRPEVEVVNFAAEQPAVFKFTVQGPPDVELGQYQGVEVAAVSFPVGDTDVEQALQEMQEQHARLVESPADCVADGDFVNLAYEGFIDGEAFAGGKADDYTLEIGSNTFVPGFESQLIGLAKGESSEINVVFPEDYRNEQLAGKPAIFKVEIKDIKQKEVPALDDEFASEVSEFATLEELREDVKNKLQESASQRERSTLEGKVVEAVVANAKVELPEVLVSGEIDEMLEELAYNLSRQGFPEEFAREYISGKQDSIRQDYRDAAESRVKTRLVLDKIKELEAVAVSDEELEAKIQEMASFYQQDADEIRKKLEEQGSLEVLRSNVANEKTIKLLVESALQVGPAEAAENDQAEATEAE